MLAVFLHLCASPANQNHFYIAEVRAAGHYAAIITAIVLLSAAVNFFQTYRSQRVIDRLRAKVTPTSTAMRDGSFRELPGRELVPGDIVRLAAGDMVPADARLLEARDLEADEAALSGESMPVEKRPGDEVYLGTSVVSGTATAQVVATAALTHRVPAGTTVPLGDHLGCAISSAPVVWLTPITSMSCR